MKMNANVLILLLFFTIVHSSVSFLYAEDRQEGVVEHIMVEYGFSTPRVVVNGTDNITHLHNVGFGVMYSSRMTHSLYAVFIDYTNGYSEDLIGIHFRYGRYLGTGRRIMPYIQSGVQLGGRTTVDWKTGVKLLPYEFFYFNMFILHNSKIDTFTGVGIGVGIIF